MHPTIKSEENTNESFFKLQPIRKRQLRPMILLPLDTKDKMLLQTFTEGDIIWDPS